MTPKEQSAAYQRDYAKWLKAHKQNDPLNDFYGKEPNPADYGLVGSEGEWLAKHLRGVVNSTPNCK